MEELSYVFIKYFIACVPVRFNSFHYRSFSPCWPLTFLIFSPPLWNSSPLFLITRSSSFSVIHVSVDIKNNVEKDSTLSKSPGGHAISRQKHLELPVVSYLLIGYFTLVCLWRGRTVGRTVTWLPKFLGWMDYQKYKNNTLKRKLKRWTLYELTS